MIDFQDAVAGSRAYDLISLIEDARRDVSPELAEIATAHYLAAMRAQGTPLDEDHFRAEMAVMAAQRNAKIVGIFARLYTSATASARYLVLSAAGLGLSGARPAAIRRWPVCAHGMIVLFPTARRILPELESRVIRTRHDHGGGAGHAHAPADR